MIAVTLAIGAGVAPSAWAADDGNFLILGVIATDEADSGVALVKDTGSSKTFAARVGYQLNGETTIRGITRTHVYLRVGSRVEKVAVGDQVDTRALGASTASVGDEAGGIERSGNVVRVSSAFKEQVVKRDLGKVLMQAAAVPYYVNGELGGFRLWDIDAGSVYDRAGFADGDIITAINGQTLSDVGMTVKVLRALAEETRADVTFMRKGVEQTLQILIQ